MRDYEDGKLILMDGIGAGLPIDADEWAFLDKLVLPSVVDNNRVKKAKLKELLAPVDAAYAKKHVLTAFGLDKNGAVRFQGIIQRVNAELEKGVRALFPDYVIKNANATWRFTVTEAEEMHYDSYGYSTDEDHKVRLFVNMDNVPRLWGASHSMPAAVAVYADRIRQANVDLGEHPNLFNATLNKLMPWPEVPRTFLAFAPGAAWLVNSQLASHEIIFGRRMIGFTCDIEASSMQDPAKSFQSRAREALGSLR